jgi:hypothetical protein
MRLSYSAIWDDAAALIRAHGQLLAPLAGVFLFLPALVLRELATIPSLAEAKDLVHAVAAFQAYVAMNWPLLLATRLVELVGSIAILELALGPRGTSVGAAIVVGVLLLPFYFATLFLANVAIALGCLLLFVPGLYLGGRLAPFPAVVVAERVRNPIAALRRTFALTDRRGWAILGLVVLVMVATAVISIVSGSVVGLVVALLAGKAIGTFAAATAAAAAGAGGQVVILALFAALYRALTTRGSAEVFR